MEYDLFISKSDAVKNRAENFGLGALISTFGQNINQ